MKVCLTSRENNTWAAMNFSDVLSFSRGVDDGEVTELMCDFFLSSHFYKDVPALVSLILQKVRIGGEVVFIDFDWRSLAKAINRGSALKDINGLLQGHSFKSVLAMEELESFLTDGFVIEMKQFHGDSFVLKAKRVK